LPLSLIHRNMTFHCYICADLITAQTDDTVADTTLPKRQYDTRQPCSLDTAQAAVKSADTAVC